MPLVLLLVVGILLVGWTNHDTLGWVLIALGAAVVFAWLVIVNFFLQAWKRF